MKSELNAPHIKQKKNKLTPSLLKMRRRHEGGWDEMWKRPKHNWGTSRILSSSLFTDRNTIVEYSEIPHNDPTQRAIAKANGKNLHPHRQGRQRISRIKYKIREGVQEDSSHITHHIYDLMSWSWTPATNPKPTTATQRTPPWQVNPFKKKWKIN